MHQTVARDQFHKENVSKKLMFGAAPDLRGRVLSVSAARMLIYLAQCCCYVDLEAAVTERIGTAARSKA